MNLKKYFEIGKGTIPIILSCPHGGYKKPQSILNKEVGPQIADKNTYIIAKWLLYSLKKKNIAIYYILNKIHRSKLDLNRPPASERAYNPKSIEAQSIHNAYHDILSQFSQECIENHKKCLLLDFHGFTKPKKDYPDVIFGHIFGKTLQAPKRDDAQDCSQFWGCNQLEREISKYFTLDDGLAINDFNLSYSGGYITQKFYNYKDVSAIQIEVAKYIRKDYYLTKKLISSLTSSIEYLLEKQD
jgi:N-formylglutamate amidohydrolase